MTTLAQPSFGARLRPWVTAAPWPIRLAIALLAGGWILLTVLLVRWGPGDYPGRDVWLYLALVIGSAAVVLARAVRRHTDRPVWIALGGALLVSACGDIAYLTLVSGNDSERFPSVADAIYLAYYPLCIIAVVMFVSRRVRGVPSAVRMDGAVLAVAVGALVGAVFLAPLSGGLAGGAAAVVVGAAYPIGDTVVLLLAAMGVTLVGIGRARALIWMSAAMAVSACADLTYWNLLAVGAYEEGMWLDALWPLSSIVLALVAWLPGHPYAAPVTGTRSLLIVPGVSLVAATATLAYGTARNIPVITVVLAVGALLGVLHRLYIAMNYTVLMMEAHREATTDYLTGLPNRRGFAIDAEELLARGGATRGAKLLVADVDGFKEVNDSLGHVVGDDILSALSSRLAELVSGTGCVLGRLGGDEFAVLVPGGHVGNAMECAERLRSVVALPFVIEGMSVTMTASVGISSAPRDGTQLSDLLRRADIARHRAKTDQLGIAAFDASADLAGEDRLHRVEELRSAIGAGELVLHYQPKIALDDRMPIGVEALVRWKPPGAELIYPDAFLPLARRAGLMQVLTEAVVVMALDESVTWRKSGLSLPIAVNLPAAALIDDALPTYLADALGARGLPGSALQVEITEEALLREPKRAGAVLGGIRALGVEIAIDDYGTGYSSLAYLRELVVDDVKIDRSFVGPMLVDGRACSIVKYTIDLAHALGLRVVAEGVESAEVAEALEALGCDVAQGYHWTRPLAAEALTTWLRDYAKQQDVAVRIS